MQLFKFNNFFNYSYLVILLAPFLILCLYTYPGNEDYAQSMLSQDLGAFGHFKDLYFTYDGRYFSAILYAINPLVNYHFTTYKLIPLIHLIGLFTGILLIITEVLPYKLKFEYSLLITLALFTASIYNFPSMPAAFYYMVSTIVYFTPLVLFFFLIVLINKMYKSKIQFHKLLYILVSSLLILAILGSNEIYLILLPYTFFLIFTYRVLYRKRQLTETIILCFATTCGIYLNLSAPGLKDHFTQDPIDFSVIYSLQQIKTTLLQSSLVIIGWLKEHFILWGITFLYIPIAYKIALSESIKISKSLLLVSFGVTTLIFLILPLPYYWTLGHGMGNPPERIFNILYFMLPFQWLFFLQTLVIILHDKLTFLSKVKVKFIVRLTQLSLITLLVFGSSWFTAFEDLYSGEAYRYHQEIQTRFDLLNNSNENEIVKLSKIKNTPETIYSGFDLEINRTGSWNDVYESYFNVKEVIIDENSSE